MPEALPSYEHNRLSLIITPSLSGLFLLDLHGIQIFFSIDKPSCPVVVETCVVEVIGTPPTPPRGCNDVHVGLCTLVCAPRALSTLTAVKQQPKPHITNQPTMTLSNLPRVALRLSSQSAIVRNTRAIVSPCQNL